VQIGGRVGSQMHGRTPLPTRHHANTEAEERNEAPRMQTNPHRKRKRDKVFTAADTTPIQARIPNAMFLEIERAARRELISIADFVRAALLEKLKQERDKNET
jgi:hypothetical protein